MIAVLLQTLPFFALIALGYGAAKSGFFGEEATAYLTKFVFYFALSAMLIRFALNLSLAEVFDWSIVFAYLTASFLVYAIATIVALARKRGLQEAAVEAQCAVIGNLGFLGIPLLLLLFGEQAIPGLMFVLVLDLVVFSSLIVILITGSRDGRVSVGVLGTVAKGLVKNPMIVSIVVGLVWSGLAWPVPAPVMTFLDVLGAAATPCALFVIGASLASNSAERLSVAVWLSSLKLFVHPAAVAVAALLIFSVDPFTAGVMIAASALPVAGNVFILAQSYGVAPMRVSASILVSTIISVVSFSAVIAWVQSL